MKGLLLKDFYQTIKYCKMFFLIDIVFIAVSFFSEDNSMFIGFPVLFSGILPLTLLSYDERGGWTDYCGILPYGEKKIVSAKYLFGLLVQAFTVVVVTAASFIRGYVYRDFDFSANMIAVGVLFAVSLVFPALCLPFCYKFGSENGRIAYFIVIAVMIGVFMPMYGRIVDNSENITGISLDMWIPLIVIGIIALYIVSWLLSVRLLRSVKK